MSTLTVSSNHLQNTLVPTSKNKWEAAPQKTNLAQISWSELTKAETSNPATPGPLSWIYYLFFCSNTPKLPLQGY